MKPWLALLIGVMGCFALAWLCAELIIETIEDDLVARTEKALENLNIRNLQVAADGRDVVLEGEAPTEAVRQTAHVKAEAVDGTFTVLNRLRVAKDRQPAPSPADPPMDCCEAMAPDKEKPGSREGDRALPKSGADTKSV